ncbi:MAG: sigma-54-dependent Fis family transcriptional regulator [Spirochaetes bacterium]|nr:sigma-54-dependent Fis family transcriptional regulator [Spirochaetota bacterium]
MNILIIDDDFYIRNFFTEILTVQGHTVFTAENGSIGYDYFIKEKIDLCFLDLWMPEMGGIDILKRIKEDFPSVEVIMISGEAKISHAVKAAKIGAFDFIEKPLSVKEILNNIKIIEYRIKTGLKPKHFSLRNFDDTIIGDSPAIQSIKKLIDTAAKSDARILITGENGTGKELVAREIQFNSMRKSKPFVSINCAAIPENLIESELFGYVKGAFTGAGEDRIGKIESANSGTLFLDEIADMSLATQSKLLRVLQEMKITKIGSTVPQSVDVRVISATNKDLFEEVKNGNFREDLYYRLNVIPIFIPPLRDRIDDIPLLIDYYNNKISSANKNKSKKFDAAAVEFMKDFSWSGNIRQLRNIIERLIVMIQSDNITLEDVKKYIDEDALMDDTNVETKKYDSYKLNIAKDEFEKDFIEKKLKENNYNLSKTANALGVYVSNLHSKINKLGIDIDKLKNKKK